MAISEKDIFESLMKDPNHAYNPIGKVWAEAQQRARQFRNNEKALALAFEEPSALSKLENFLTKADGNVEREDMPRGFDTSSFFNDYTNLEVEGPDEITWADFQNKYKNFTPYIHRVFGLNLDAEDSPDEADYIADEDLYELINLLDNGEPVPDKAPERAKEESAEPPETPDVTPEAEAEVPEETPSLNDEEEEHLQGWLDSVYPLADHKEIREGIINQLEEEGFGQLREDNLAWSEILQRAQAANLVPEFPSEEPSLDDPTPEAEAETPSSLLDEPAEAAEAEEVRERPNFSNSENPKAETYQHLLDQSSNLPSSQQHFLDSQGITWASFKDMHDFLFDEETGLFSTANINANHGIHSESDVRADDTEGPESLGERNWPIGDFRGIITDMKNKGRTNQAGNIRDNLRSSYLRYFDIAKGVFPNRDNVEALKYHMGQQWADAIASRAKSRHLPDSVKEQLNNFVQTTFPEERMASQAEIKSMNSALKTEQATPRSPQAEKTAEQINTMRTALAGSDDILDEVDPLVVWQEQKPSGDFPVETPKWGDLDEDDFNALKDFIPRNARVSAENPTSLKNTVYNFQRLSNLKTVIHRLNRGERSAADVSDDEIQKAYTAYNTLFSGRKLKEGISKAIKDADVQLSLMRLMKEPNENYRRRLDWIEGQIPWISKDRKKGEPDSVFEQRIKDEAIKQAQIGVTTASYEQAIKPVAPKPTTPRRVRAGRQGVSASPQISSEQNLRDLEASMQEKATEAANQRVIEERRKDPDLSDADADMIREMAYDEEFKRLKTAEANKGRGGSTLISPEGEELRNLNTPVDTEPEFGDNLGDSTAASLAELESDIDADQGYTDDSDDVWTRKLEAANNGSPLSLDHLLTLMTETLADKLYSAETPEGVESERYVIAKKFNDDGSINPFWMGRTVGAETNISHPRNVQDGIDPILHPSFEGEEIRELQKAGLVIPQGTGRWASGINYKWTEEGQRLQGVISSMPRVSKVGVDGTRGRNGLIPNEFIPALIALHKSNGALYHPSYEHEENLFHASLRTNGNGENTSDEEVVEEPIVNEDGTSEGGTLDSTSDVVVNGEGESNLDTPEDIDEAHQNPNSPESGATLEHLYALGPRMNGQPLFPRDADGNLFDPTKGDMAENYDSLMEMFHDLWDRHNPESIQRKYGKHSLDGHPYITDKGKELPAEANPYMYQINPAEFQDEETINGYNKARKQAGLLEGWLNVLQKHLDAANPGEYPVHHIYADTTVDGDEFSSNHNKTDDGKELGRDDLKIADTHWSWLDAMMGLGFTYHEGGEDEFVPEGDDFSDPNEWIPLFHKIDHSGHRLSRDSGHGLSFFSTEKTRDAFPAIVAELLGEHGEWFAEQEEAAKSEFLKEFGRPPVDPETRRRPHGQYGKGAEEGSFAQAWRSYQAFLGNSPDRWGPTGTEPEERRRRAEEFPFMQWVQDVLDDKNPEGHFPGHLSDILHQWVWNTSIRGDRKFYETENNIPVYADRATQPELIPNNENPNQEGGDSTGEGAEGTGAEGTGADTGEGIGGGDADTTGTEAQPQPSRPLPESAWEWVDDPKNLSGRWELKDPVQRSEEVLDNEGNVLLDDEGEPFITTPEPEAMPDEPPSDMQRRNKRIKDILVEEYGEDWKGHPHVEDEIESLLDKWQGGGLDNDWNKRVVEARKKKRDEQAKADAKEAEKKENDSSPMSESDRDRMLKEIQDAYQEQHGIELDPRQQSLLLNYAQNNPDQFIKEHANELKRAATAREKQAQNLREHEANNINGHNGIPALAGRSDIRSADLVQQANLIENWRHKHFQYMGQKERAILEERWKELNQVAAHVEGFDLDAEIEKGKKFAEDNELEYGSDAWHEAIGGQHVEELDTANRYKNTVAQGGDLRANRNYKPWLVVKYDENGNGTLCDVREKDINGDWGKPIEGGKRALQFDDDQHYFDYKKDPEDLSQQQSAADHFWTNKLDYANLRPHDGQGGVEDVAEFASHKGMFGERGAIGGWYHPESGAWINPHRYNDIRSELEGAGEGSGMAILSGEAYHGSHRADGTGEVNPRYGFAGRGDKQRAKLGNDDLSYYVDGQGNIAHAHGDWNQVQQRNNNQVQSVNDVIHDWHSQNMYNMVTNFPDSFKDENGSIKSGAVLRPPQAQGPQPLQNADLLKEVKAGDALERRRRRATDPIRQNVFGSGLGEDELAGTGQFWSEGQEYKQRFNDVLDLVEDVPLAGSIFSWAAKRLANIKTLGFTPDSEKVIRRVRNAYKIHANTQKRTKKNMDDLSTSTNQMSYISPGESIARKEDTTALRTHLEKERRRLMRESANQMLDDSTRKKYQQDAMDIQAKRDIIVGLNPDLNSHWKQINDLHMDIFGGDALQDNLVPHSSEGVGSYAARFAQPLPSAQQPGSYPSPVSGLLGDSPTQMAPQKPKIQGLLDIDEPEVPPQQDLNPPEANEAPNPFRNPPYEGGGEPQAPKSPVQGLLG